MHKARKQKKKFMLQAIDGWRGGGPFLQSCTLCRADSGSKSTVAQIIQTAFSGSQNINKKYRKNCQKEVEVESVVEGEEGSG